MDHDDQDSEDVPQPYELFTFARMHALPLETAREIVERFGGDREGADAAAKMWKDALAMGTVPFDPN
jgi:hypothetical protein